MKTPGLIVTLLLATFAFAPAKLNAQSSQKQGYSAKLISPRLGQVLRPGQQVRVEWDAALPDMRNLHACEMEIWLSLDGGRTFSTCIAPVGTNIRYYNWTVPNTPTNAAVLDIRFGCEMYYPETPSPQPASTFVIAQGAPPVH
ncbi:MAG: hypothetical protein DMF20_01220 [Verrucomicrobia bacterium]|jgi:hypothetical protein|nr:MAG: hypothetical protein DME48_01145 [Verrucomicrobiota bacterium]PYL68314.1 MAG: hypothetical protein DMF20_01220 [Verrucomicrobiota bacterium]